MTETKNNPLKNKKGFLESIHLIRGIAALLVLIDHTFGWIDLGSISIFIKPNVSYISSKALSNFYYQASN